MLLTLIKYRAQIASGVAGAMLAGSLVWLAWGIDSAATDALHAAAIASERETCQKNMKAMEAISDALHTSAVAADNDAYAASLRIAAMLSPPTPTGSTVAPSCNATADRAHGGGLEQLSRDTFAIAGDCQKERGQLNLCIDYLEQFCQPRE